MSTRAASAASSRRAKQRLIQILFGPQYSGRGFEAHKKLDYASYSYMNLRAAYLDRLQSIHPDKLAHQQTITDEVASEHLPKSSADPLQNGGKCDHRFGGKRGHDAFVELQNAWADYEQFAKMLRRVNRVKRTEEGKVIEEEEEPGFTMFGVGCSFSDSPEERDRRNEIMDQACRGWFSAGLLSENSNSTSTSAKSNINHGMSTSKHWGRSKSQQGPTSSSSTVNLLQDDLFVMETNFDEKSDHNNDLNSRYSTDAFKTSNRKKGRERRSLIDQMFPGGKIPTR